jgi:uncharacterized membrane protein
MGRGRLEAFSDGVLAVIITIMVLELKVPHGADLAALGPLIPVFLSPSLRFIDTCILFCLLYQVLMKNHCRVHLGTHVSMSMV